MKTITVTMSQYRWDTFEKIINNPRLVTELPRDSTDSEKCEFAVTMAITNLGNILLEMHGRPPVKLIDPTENKLN